MVTVPAVTPRTVPVALTVAIVVLLLLHVPPVTPSTKVDEEPGHTLVTPDIVPADGVVFTTTARKVSAVPQLLVTV